MYGKTKDMKAKLGLKPGDKAFILYSPKNYDLSLPFPNLLNGIFNYIDWLQAFYVDTLKNR